jgi:hypothetical protein
MIVKQFQINNIKTEGKSWRGLKSLVFSAFASVCRFLLVTRT